MPAELIALVREKMREHYHVEDFDYIHKDGFVYILYENEKGCDLSDVQFYIMSEDVNEPMMFFEINNMHEGVRCLMLDVRDGWMYYSMRYDSMEDRPDFYYKVRTNGRDNQPILEHKKVQVKLNTFAEVIDYIRRHHEYELFEILSGERIFEFLNELRPGERMEKSLLQAAFEQRISAKIMEALGSAPEVQQILMLEYIKVLVELGFPKNNVELVLWTYAEALGWSEKPKKKRRR
jgi:hypothetical protein